VRRWRWWRFFFQTCDVCEMRRCAVWATFGDRKVSPAVFLMHRAILRG
jgi:hypothetical protein